MKKTNNTNNKYKNNTIYSLNYKFDSVSAAGKVSGTALELIKKYNELAKEAHSNGDYVEMEVFRQYAEHYRKIVTEINERKNQNRENMANNQQTEMAPTENSETVVNASENLENQNTAQAEVSLESPCNNGLVETEAAEPQAPKHKTLHVHKKSFTVVEVSGENVNTATETEQPKPAKSPRKCPRRKVENKENLKATENTDAGKAE